MNFKYFVNHNERILSITLAVLVVEFQRMSSVADLESSVLRTFDGLDVDLFCHSAVGGKSLSHTLVQH